MSGGGAAASVAVVLALLVGCSNEDPPASLPSAPTTTTEATPTPTTSASPTPATSGAPTVPAAAHEQTPDGAAAFVQHWYDTLGYSWTVMDSAPIRALGSCLTCIQFADTIDEVAGRGNLLEGGVADIKSIQPNAAANGNSSTVVLFSAGEQREVTLAGDLVNVIGEPVDDLQYLFDLEWVQGGWSVASIRVVR